jgi:hypothetical protein
MQNAWDRKYTPPRALQPMPKDIHCPKVPGYHVVSIEALQNAPQPSSDLGHRRMHPAAQRLLNLLQQPPSADSPSPARP